MKILRKQILLVPALVASLAGCDGLFGNDNQEAQREQFNAAFGHWQSLGIDTYSYALELACACAPASQLREVRVTVENGAVASITYEDNDAAAPSAVFGPYDTIEELFSAVEEAISQDPDVLSVVYDPQYGFPSLLQYDPSNSDSGDHLIFVIGDFQTPDAT